MTPLGQTLMAEIAACGPMRLDRYMQRCLLDPRHGYYTTREPFGTKGDFITAPEISQMFGELLGLALAQAWLDQGAPRPFVLAEIGPGRGTLMADLLRAVAHVPGFLEAAELWLVEPSRRLRAVQCARLRAQTLRHADRLGELPEAPLFLVANEAFDALPIRQFEQRAGAVMERYVSLTEGGDALALSLAPVAGAAPLGLMPPEGKVAELCVQGQDLASEIGARVSRCGAAFLIDYGAEGGIGDTLQALWEAAPDDPLAHPGEADLTAHVDFGALAQAALAAGARVFGPTGQGPYLERLGITARAEALAKRGDHKDIAAAHRRLTHPDEMGQLFKVLGLGPKTLRSLPGFSA